MERFCRGICDQPFDSHGHCLSQRHSQVWQFFPSVCDLRIISYVIEFSVPEVPISLSIYINFANNQVKLEPQMRPYTFVVICFSPRPCIPSESWIQLSQRHCRFLQWHLYQSHGTTQKKKLRNKGLQALTVKYHKVKDEPKENWGRPVDRRTIREPARFLEVVESPIRLGKGGDGNATTFITVQIFQNEAGNLCDEWPTCRQKPKV